MVFEVDQDSNVVHIKSLEKPQSSKKAPEESPSADAAAEGKSTESEADVTAAVVDEPSEPVQTEVKEPDAAPEEPWPATFNEKLSSFLTPTAIEDLKKIYLEGPEPPLVSDNGWAGRAAKKTEEETADGSISTPTVEEPKPEEPKPRGARERGGRGRDKRGGRGGRGGGRGGNSREDTRKVVSEVRSLGRSY